MRIAIAPLLVLVTSCASAPPIDSPPPAGSAAVPVAVATAAPSATAAAQPGGPSASTPYTAAEIRAASPAGRRIVFRIDVPGKPSALHVIEFMSVDANGAEIRSTDMDMNN